MSSLEIEGEGRSALADLYPLALSEEERFRVKIARTKPILADTQASGVMGITASALIATLCWRYNSGSFSPAVPWLWWLAYSVTSLQIIAIARAYVRGPRLDADVLRTSQKLLPYIIVAGCVWGASAWLMLPNSNGQAESILLIGNAMVLMGVTNGRSNDRASLLAYMIPATIIFVTGLWRLGDLFHVSVGVGFVIFSSGLIAFAKVQENAIVNAVYLRMKTEQLLVERIAQQRETDKARQEAERAKEQAEIANQGKTTFLTAAGHDLRQPVHALLQYFGQLKRLNEDARLDETIGRMEKSLDSMQGLLDSILEVSKLMMGSVKPNWAEVDITGVFDRVEAQMRPIAESKGLVLKMTGSNLVVRSDEVLLERILCNLVLNAIRYTERGHVTVRAKPRGERLVIQVVDSGIGIAREQHERIFDAFYQVANEARDRRRGLGLGLTNVRQLSDLLSIDVRLRSKKGKGTLFILERKLATPESNKVSTVAHPDKVDFASGAMVILIDDNEESLQATEASLRAFGCRVISATSGMQAIERLSGQEFMPQLVVSDYRLVGETGLEAIQVVIENQQALFGDELAMAALVISGDTAPSEMERVSMAGYPMIHKPLRFDEFYQVVNDQLKALAFSDGRRGLPAGITTPK